MLGKIQQEISGVSSCLFRKGIEDEASLTYIVDDFEKHQDSLVAWNEAESDVSCSCRSFEYKGFLCRHALLALQMSGLNSIPLVEERKSWAKCGKIVDQSSSSGEAFQSSKLAMKLSEARSLSQEAYNTAFQTLEEVLIKCVSEKGSLMDL